MRERKWRAWDGEAERFTYSDIEDENYVWGISKGRLQAWAIIENPGTIDEPVSPGLLELSEPDDFTGLRDKNGVKVYEGDICLWRDNKRGEVVVFDRGCFSCLSGNGWCPLKAMIGDIAVIGNIHENPDLLDSPKVTEGVTEGE